MRKRNLLILIMCIICFIFTACTPMEGRYINLDNGKILSVFSTDDYNLGIDEGGSTMYILPEERNVIVRYDVIEYSEMCRIKENIEFVKTDDAYVSIWEDGDEERMIYLRPFLQKDTYNFDDDAEYWMYIAESINDDGGLDRDILRMENGYSNNVFDLFLSLEEE